MRRRRARSSRMIAPGWSNASRTGPKTSGRTSCAWRLARRLIHPHSERNSIMTIAKTNGIDLAYDSFGDEADEAILLIAGLGTQMIRWTVPFCEALAARGYRVLRFDNRDSGRSTHFHHCAPPDFGALAAALMAGQRPEVPYTLHDMAADAIGLLDALAINRAHVVGRSMGGMIAQIMASEHPERVLSLTSIMSSTGNPRLPQAASDVMAMMMRPAPDLF